MFEAAAATADLYLPLLTAPATDPQLDTVTASTTPDPARIRILMAQAAVEFDKGRQIEAARLTAADYLPDPTAPNAHSDKFLGCSSSLDLLIHRYHSDNACSRPL